MTAHTTRGWLFAGLLGLLAPAGAPAQSPDGAMPGAMLSIVIDDLGNNPREDRRAVALPGPVAVAILPHTPGSSALAEDAHRSNKEVLLHLPMDPEEGTQAEAGPGRLENQMSAPEIRAMFLYDLQTVPYAVGVNNHMGSLLTQNTSAMQALMRTIHRHGELFFLDSRTSAHSIAARVAVEQQVPTLERDVFLDDEPGEDVVRNSIHRLERLLAVRGYAIAIGHPHPDTLAVLERWLPTAAAHGIRLVPLSVMLKWHHKEPANGQRPASARAGL